MKASIDQLELGQEGLIEDLSLDQIPLSLLEMGCLPGERVQLVQRAPLGDPLYIKVNDSHIAIRRETAQRIQVKLV